MYLKNYSEVHQFFGSKLLNTFILELLDGINSEFGDDIKLSRIVKMKTFFS